MAAQERDRKRRTFDRVAEQYDRARPGYPRAFFDDFLALAGLAPGARVLEIGCGTGQATLPLAERGLEVTAVELGERLAAVARRKLENYPAHVVVADFETWEPPPDPFDAVLSVNAFHWIDPEVGYEKAHRLLRSDGVLALGGVVHVLPERGDTFWVEVQEDYDAIVPRPENRPPPRPDDVADLKQPMEASGHFRHLATRRYPCEFRYTAEQYVDLMGTYSPNLLLDADTRDRLFERIRRRIEARPGGAITAYVVFMLNLARKL